VSDAPPKLAVGAIVRAVGRAYARHWKFLVPLAVVVLLPQALGDAIKLHVDTGNLEAGRLVVSGLSLGGIFAISLGGEALYAGIVTALMLEWRHGVEHVSLGELARSLPLLRLIVADLVIAAGTALGLLLLVVPGVLFATYFLITTVMIETEDRSVPQAMRRSASLVRGNFWRVLAVGLVTVLGTEVVSAALEAPFHGLETETAVNLAVEAIVEPFQGLATVLVAFGLMELRGERPGSQTSRRPASDPRVASE
jgi:hypothetical protein